MVYNVDMGSPKRIRVVLADDHPLLRQGIRHVLEQTEDIEVVGETGNGEQALELVKSLKPDILICDIRMPVLSGIEVIRRLKEYSPGTRSVILSAYDNDEYVFEAMANGASGYLLKTADVNEFSETVRRINAGQTIMHPSAATKLTRLLSGTSPSTRNELLTAKEKEILNLAARGLRNKAISKELNMSVRTVEGHFSRIFLKLSVSSRIEAIKALQSQPVINTDNNV